MNNIDRAATAAGAINAFRAKIAGIRFEYPHLMVTSLADDLNAAERIVGLAQQMEDEASRIARRNPHSETASEAMQLDGGICDLIHQFLTGGILQAIEKRADGEDGPEMTAHRNRQDALRRVA
ncbi:MAG TPA: hypothetical protein VFG62_26000 [Rhodopila sp.]|jgi:hypothetical protein|nr:hypothetical protein [Rhodopila sp.]